MENANRYDWPELIAELNRFVRLKSTPIGIKLYKDKAELDSIPRLRRPPEDEIFNGCQLIGQAVRLNFTIGFTKESLNGSQCQAVFGLCPAQEMIDSRELTGVWYGTDEDTAKHQAAMYHLNEVYEAAVASPLVTGRLEEPDVCLIYATPQQVLLMGNALQYENYEVLNCSFVGESSCSDSWTKAILTGKPCIALPCFGERRYGGVLDEEMAIAFPPHYIHKILDGLAKLSKNGLRYPAAFYGIQHDVRAGMAKNYKK